MSLSTYKKKRDFTKSPEPTGGISETESLRFVVQKHDASHLHYDFRLEMEGVLKSWAIPKGPSTDPGIKRLAMMVENHPFDYKNFEGVIPSGYGAGTVIIWDEGFYEPAGFSSKNKKAQDKELRHQLHTGKLKITLKGKKLLGDYVLIKASERGENAWLFFKVKDQYASKGDITLKDKSVVSKKTLAQVEKTTNNFYGSQSVSEVAAIGSKESAITTRPPEKKASSRNKTFGLTKSASNDEEKTTQVSVILKTVPKVTFFTTLKPMLATLVDKPFEDQGWLYEIKWDGYRALAFMNRGAVTLKSRNDKSFEKKFYPIYDALKKWEINAIFDGEIVVLDDNGISNFTSLQNWRSEADGELYYYIFDILWLEGKDLRSLPLRQRRMILESLIFHDDIIRVSKTFEESGIEFFEAAKKMSLEGIIAKKTDSSYISGDRSKEWLKIKASKRQEMIIGGFTKNDGSSKLFSALLVGVYNNDRLHYTGKVGTGFNDKTQKELLIKFQKLITKIPPFEEVPDINKPSRFRPNPPHAIVTWLRPHLVCEVSFTEMTSDGVMRHPSFEGLRLDKIAKEVILEKPKQITQILNETNQLHDKKAIVPVEKKERKTLLNPTDETQVRQIGGHELKFTNLNKIYWPKEKITKRQLLNYYYQVAPYILPYLKDRPQSMLRHPDGITGESFFYKDITGKAPPWLETFLYHSDVDNRDRNYLVAKDDASLLYMASLGCIEMNPWHSRVQKENYPDWCIIDLDPAKNSFNQVIEAARVTKEILDSIGVPGYPKTSGSTGIHIYIPLGAKYTYEQSKEFGRVIAHLVHEEIPEFTSIERAVQDRRGKMYIDFLQNRPQATVSAPYSVRPKPGATVSIPLQWDEVKPGLKMTDFNIINALDRIRSLGDIFRPVIGKGIDMKKALSNFKGKQIATLGALF